ncbi:type VI secretion system tube protein TssD [Algoriphagus sediminis]|uniref:Type VI secretion system tube protein TssD n=1 Tax=Algoriphagus sediminis TaxID=3057113 RepID=A0ABT7Y7M4_9BACT|nr:type VI secretion system tube protein TssD [Algoriphagus sediminis]MDN3202520.1 type VI secretion system tube protein TssD [Algoriphagus sediminis]
MAQDFDIKFIDHSGNPIEGSCEQVGREGTSLANAFEYSVSRPIDATSGKSTGRKIHEPVKVWKEVDKATPIIKQNAYDGRVFHEVIIRFWRPSMDGTSDIFYTCTLRGARIVSHSTQQLHNQFEGAVNISVPLFEVIELSFESIDWNYASEGLSARDKWNSARRS